METSFGIEHAFPTLYIVGIGRGKSFSTINLWFNISDDIAFFSQLLLQVEANAIRGGPNNGR